MNWTTWIIVGGALLAFVLLKRLGLVAPAKAGELLRSGAIVIDVRSAAEFQARHLPGAVNVPLDALGEQIGRYAPTREQPILLHCLSGGRSGLAKAMLKRHGYVNAFNLGSYGRAEKILSASPRR